MLADFAMSERCSAAKERQKSGSGEVIEAAQSLGRLIEIRR
jgi:hypothetical protein